MQCTLIQNYYALLPNNPFETTIISHYYWPSMVKILIDTMQFFVVVSINRITDYIKKRVSERVRGKNTYKKRRETKTTGNQLLLPFSLHSLKLSSLHNELINFNFCVFLSLCPALLFSSFLCPLL